MVLIEQSPRLFSIPLIYINFFLGEFMIFLFNAININQPFSLGEFIIYANTLVIQIEMFVLKKAFTSQSHLFASEHGQFPYLLILHTRQSHDNLFVQKDVHLYSSVIYVCEVWLSWNQLR